MAIPTAASLIQQHAPQLVRPQPAKIAPPPVSAGLPQPIGGAQQPIRPYPGAPIQGMQPPVNGGTGSYMPAPQTTPPPGPPPGWVLDEKRTGGVRPWDAPGFDPTHGGPFYRPGGPIESPALDGGPAVAPRPTTFGGPPVPIAPAPKVAAPRPTTFGGPPVPIAPAPKVAAPRPMAVGGVPIPVNPTKLANVAGQVPPPPSLKAPGVVNSGLGK
jgi:hypothetical protein